MLLRDGRYKKLVASFDAEYEASIPRLERAVGEEPARLLTNCDDVRKLCRVRPSFAALAQLRAYRHATNIYSCSPASRE